MGDRKSLTRGKLGKHWNEGARLLWAYLEEHGLNPEDLQEQLGTVRSTLTKWAYGDRRPSGLWPGKLEAACGVPRDAWYRERDPSKETWRVPGARAA